MQLEFLLPQKKPAFRFLRSNWLVCAVYLLATAQFAGTYYFQATNFLDYNRFEHGYERLPFQTRLLLAPLLRWADNSALMVKYASHLSQGRYFFPDGISPQDVLLFFLNIACLLIAGWVAVRIYQAATRRSLMEKFVYPIFLVLCGVTYIWHTVQNFRFVYDLPSLALFSLGLYLIYFRKPIPLFVLVFAIATLNRETSLLLLPFYMCSAALDEDGRLEWKRMFSSRVLAVVMPLVAYWTAWHLLVFHLFRANASEYYPRITFNLHVLTNLKFFPQLLSALCYLPVFLFLYRRRLRDPQLRSWLWVLPVWFAFMFFWGVLPETRVYGELIPYVACVSAILAEEAIASRAAGEPPDEVRELDLAREVEEVEV